MENAFYFTLKALFVLKIFKFFVLAFWSCIKTGWLGSKVKFEIYIVTTWLISSCNAHYCPISQEVKAIGQWNLAS